MPDSYDLLQSYGAGYSRYKLPGRCVVRLDELFTTDAETARIDVRIQLMRAVVESLPGGRRVTLRRVSRDGGGGWQGVPDEIQRPYTVDLSLRSVGSCLLAFVS